MAVRIAVIGAGPVGLSTAVNIIEQVPSVQVTVIADRFSPNTTGDCAAGIFGNPKDASDQTRAWLKASLQHALEILHGPDAVTAGIHMITFHTLHIDEADIMPDIPHFGSRQATPEERALYNIDLTSAEVHSSLVVDCNRYLPWLLRRFQNAGGKTIHQTVKNFEELYLDYDVIVNCSGAGAYHLGDKDVVPSRGQIVRVRAPWVKHAVLLFSRDLAIIPFCNDVLLVGTAQEGRWDTEPDPQDTQHVMEECSQLMPSLKNASIIHEWVGLRPCRSSVRLETETRNTTAGKTIKIVHHYGHGKYGVCQSWGSALEATKLVQQAVQLLTT